MGFREYLKDELAYQGITTKDLAEKAGVNKRTIDHYLMNNPQEPSVTNAHRIAVALGVSIEYLLTGKEYNGYRPVTGEILELVNEFSNLSKEQRELFFKLIKNVSKLNTRR